MDHEMPLSGEAAASPSGAPESGDWRRALTREERAALATLHRGNAWTQLKPLALLAIWLVAATIAIKIDRLPLRLFAWLVIGATVHCFGAFVHDCAHLSVYRKPWLDRIVGFLCGLPGFFPSANYRATHMLHHKYLNTPHDPDALAANVPNPRLRAAIFYGWLLVGVPFYSLTLIAAGPFRARRKVDKILCVVEPLAMLVFYVALFAAASRYHFGNVLALGWLWALPVALIIGNFRGLAEHAQLAHGDPPDPLRIARTVETSPVVSFFLNNLNYHLEHHLYPGIPWNNLPKVHLLLSPVLKEGRASIAGGYRGWALRALRYGPNCTFSYRELKAYLD
jgi:fatty acid desaturase